jgi:hypothetical protein
MKRTPHVSFHALLAAVLVAAATTAAAGLLLVDIGHLLETISGERISTLKGIENLRRGFREISLVPGSYFAQPGGSVGPMERDALYAQAKADLAGSISRIDLSRLSRPERQAWADFEIVMTLWSRLADELVREAGEDWGNRERLATIARDDLPLLETHRAAVQYCLDQLAETALSRAEGGASDVASDADRYGRILLAALALAATVSAMAAWRRTRTRPRDGDAPGADAGPTDARPNVTPDATPDGGHVLPERPLASLPSADRADVPEIPIGRQEVVPGQAAGSRGEFPLPVQLLRLHQAVFDIGWTLRQEMNSRENDTPEQEMLRAVDMEATSRELAEASFELMDVVEELAGYSSEAAQPMFGTTRTRRLQ